MSSRLLEEGYTYEREARERKVPWVTMRELIVPCYVSMRLIRGVGYDHTRNKIGPETESRPSPVTETLAHYNHKLRCLKPA